MHKLLGQVLAWDSDYRYKFLRGVKRSLGAAAKRIGPTTPRLLLLIAHVFDVDNRFLEGNVGE